MLLQWYTLDAREACRSPPPQTCTCSRSWPGGPATSSPQSSRRVGAAPGCTALTVGWRASNWNSFIVSLRDKSRLGGVKHALEGARIALQRRSGVQPSLGEDTCHKPTRPGPATRVKRLQHTSNVEVRTEVSGRVGGEGPARSDPFPKTLRTCGSSQPLQTP